MNYLFLNYDCRYKAILKNNEFDKPKIINKSGEGQASCFSTLFSSLADSNNEIELTLFCNLKENDKGQNNFLVLSKEEVTWWLRRLQKIVDFNYVKVYTNNELQLKIKLTGNRIIVKFLCTILRIFFEHPFNEIAKDIYDLKHKIIKKDNVNFKRISALNLLLFGSEGFRSRDIHAVADTKQQIKPITINKLKTELLKKEHWKLHDVFSYSNGVTIKQNNHTNSKEWREEENFNKRVNQYLKICKREKNLLH